MEFRQVRTPRANYGAANVINLWINPEDVVAANFAA